MKNRMVMGLTVVIATGRNHLTGKKKKKGSETDKVNVW